MDVQTVLDELVDGQPVYAEELSRAAQLVGQSGLLQFVALRLKGEFVSQTSMDDTDEQILQRVRELRWQINLLNEVGEQFSRVMVKELSDE